jgi:putative intracellular protease/amidase
MVYAKRVCVYRLFFRERGRTHDQENVAPELKLAGAEYVDIPVDEAVVDGNLVTAPAWPAHPEWLAKFLRVMHAEITVEEVPVAAG